MRQTKLQRYLRFQEMIGLTDKTQFVEQLGKLEFVEVNNERSLFFK